MAFVCVQWWGGVRPARLDPGTPPRAPRSRYLFRGGACMGRAVNVTRVPNPRGQCHQVPWEGAVGVAADSVPPLIDPHSKCNSRPRPYGPAPRKGRVEDLAWRLGQVVEGNDYGNPVPAAERPVHRSGACPWRRVAGK